MSVTGEPDGDPQKVGVALVDVVAGLYATVGVLAALRHRDATGEGQLVEVDLLSALLGAMANQSTAYTAAGVVARRMGNDHPSVAPYELLPAADGRFAVAVGNDRLFGVFCAALGRPELAADPRYATNLERVAHREQLRADLDGVLRATPALEWVSRLQAAGVPAGPVNDVAGAFALADSLGLQPVVHVPRADGSTLALPRNPIRMSRTPATYRTAPPPLGGAAPAGTDGPGTAARGAGAPERPAAGPSVPGPRLTAVGGVEEDS
jgi:crotonobetainyl-CoA:carnitine CoA-transferase CaiB-like acyl-CoA transferase